GFNQNQRINHLRFSQVAGGLNVTTTAGATLSPPGHYMLFILNGNGVPSVARMIQLLAVDNPPQFTLTVVKAGSGSGTETSSPEGVSCGGTCSAPFDQSTSVTLMANTDVGSSFTGWSGEGCSGTGTCTVSMTQARRVTATFTPHPIPSRTC